MRTRRTLVCARPIEAAMTERRIENKLRHALGISAETGVKHGRTTTTRYTFRLAKVRVAKVLIPRSHRARKSFCSGPTAA